MTERNRPAARRTPVVAGRRGRRPGFVVPVDRPAAPSADLPPPAAAQAPVDPEHTGAPEPAATAEPAAVGAGAPGRTGGRGRATAVLAVLALGSLVAAGTVWQVGERRVDRERAQQRASEQARDAAAAAAKSAATAVLSYDYRHLSADTAKAEAFLTGRLRDDYRKLQEGTVASTARQVKASVTATVKGVAVLAASPESATVLVFVDQLSRNTKIAAPRMDQDRVRMQLAKVDGKWLVREFEAI